jgi:PRD1 phage membrane DNA delivery
MGNQVIAGIFTVASAIVAVAILATLVSRNAQTPQVLEAAGSAFSNSLGAALSPVTGGYGFSGPAPAATNFQLWQ